MVPERSPLSRRARGLRFASRRGARGCGLGSLAVAPYYNLDLLTVPLAVPGLWFVFSGDPQGSPQFFVRRSVVARTGLILCRGLKRTSLC